MKHVLLKADKNLSVFYITNKLRIAIQLFLCLTFTGLSAQNFSMQLSSTDASCIGNGTINVFLGSLSPESQIELNFYLLPNTATPFRTYSTNNNGNSSISHVENALPAGTYTVVAIQATVNQTTEQMAGISILNNAVPLAFNTAAQAQCNTLNLVVNTVSGNPVSYELRNTQGLTIAGPQASNTFINVSAGNYLVIVSDVCGNSTGLSVQLDSLIVAYTVYRTGAQFRFDNLISCDSIIHVSRLIFNGSNDIPDERFPIQITYTLARQNGDTTTIGATWLSNADNFQTLLIPFYSGESYDFIVNGTDACGTSFSRTDLIVAEPKSLFRTFPAICGTKFLRINNMQKHLPPITVNFISYPAGFTPWNYNANFSTDSLSATFYNIPNSIDFGDANAPGVPEGVYIIEISSCNRTETLTRQVINDTQYNIAQHQSYVGCEENQGSVNLQIRIVNTNAQADNFVAISITEAPGAFITTFGSLPYDASNNIAPTGQFYMNGLPPGVYTVQAIGACGIPLTGSFTIHPKQINFSKTLTQACGVFSINTTLNSSLGNAVQWLQKYYPESGQWGHPLTGNLYTEGNNIGLAHGLKLSDATSGNGISNSLGSYNGIASFGIFRVVAQYSIHSNGSSQNINCRDVIDIFTIEPFGITVNNYFVFTCINGNSELTIDASGIPPLNFSIIEINGVVLTNPIVNGTNPTFANLAPGQYKIRIEDLCGNVQVLTIQTNTTIPPVITPSNLCEGQDGSLTVWGLGNVNISWQKEPSSTEIAIGNTLNFQPFSFLSDAGTYLATITSPAGTCAPQIISITIDTIPTLPNAGTGQNINILESNTTMMNLFDLLIPPYDNYGVWQETTNSGEHLGGLFSAQNVDPGSYSFQYIVEGTCSGADTAYVVINVISEALEAQDDQFSMECPVSSVFNMGNVMQNDMHFGTNVNFNAYTIQTTVPDNQNALTVDSLGNIWLNENSEFNTTYQLSYQIVYTANSNITSSANLYVTIGADVSTPYFTSNLPQDTLVSCDNIPTAETLNAQNACGTVAVTFYEEIILGTCTNEFNIIRTWVASTLDSVQTTHIQIIQVVDSSAPNNIILPEIIVTCVDEIPVPNENYIFTLSSDNCGAVSVDFVNDQSNNQTCPEIITRTYRITDDCGNFTDVYQNIVVNDTLSPWASNLSSTVLSCIGELPLPDIDLITDAQDNCELLSIVHISDISNNQICSEVITRTYRLQDACSNTFDVVQLFSIQDTLAPQASTPSTLVVSCPNDVPLPDINSIENATDNCSAITIQHIQDISNGNVCFGEQIQRIFNISDECQNSIEVVQIINVAVNMANDLSIQHTNPNRCNGDDGSILLSGLYPNTNYLVNFNGLNYDVITNAAGTLILGGLTAGTYANFELLPLGCDACTIYSALSATLEDPAPPYISAGNDFSMCEGNYAILFAENPQNAVISWNNGIENGIPFEINLGQNSYIVTALLLDCYAYDTVVITVNSLPDVYAGEDQMVCANEPIVLEATGAESYMWCNFVPNGTAFLQTELQYTYSVCGVDANGCMNSDTVLVTLIPSPEPTFEWSLSESCAIPTTVNFLNTTESTSTIEHVFWNFGIDTPSENSNQISATYTEIGCYDVTLTLSYANGCSNSTTEIDAICLHPTPDANFEILTSNPQTGFPIVVNNSSENATWLSWEYGTDQSNLTNPEIIFNEHGAQQITLIATNEYGCSDSTTQFIYVENVVLLYVPNTFTPNGDQSNQMFNPIVAAGVDLETYRLYIFSSWGDLIYETADIEAGWDGKNKNMDCPDGTYIWKIEFKASNSINEQHSGQVSLIR